MNEKDILCFSPLKWNAGNQRPHQILSRCARGQRVFYIEPPVHYNGPGRIDIQKIDHLSLWTVTPYLPEETDSTHQIEVHNLLVEQFIAIQEIREYILWLYSPSALTLARRLSPRYIVYDCISSQADLSPQEKLLEPELLKKADLVFTDGQRVCKAEPLCPSGELIFPGSFDFEHFLQARNEILDPLDQFEIPHPRLGFFGVINQCTDIDLLLAVADQRPDWHIILVGPIVNADPTPLLQRKNIHYLSNRLYAELPAYLAHWDVALLPDKRQGSQSPISASQIPQYLAGGCPVVSTALPSVERCYGTSGLVWLSKTPEEFMHVIEGALKAGLDRVSWLKTVDARLVECAWEQAWEWMQQGIEALAERVPASRQRVLETVSA